MIVLLLYLSYFTAIRVLVPFNIEPKVVVVRTILMCYGSIIIYVLVISIKHIVILMSLLCVVSTIYHVLWYMLLFNTLLFIVYFLLLQTGWIIDCNKILVINGYIVKLCMCPLTKMWVDGG